MLCIIMEDHMVQAADVVITTLNQLLSLTMDAAIIVVHQTMRSY